MVILGLLLAGWGAHRIQHVPGVEKFIGDVKFEKAIKALKAQGISIEDVIAEHEGSVVLSTSKSGLVLHIQYVDQNVHSVIGLQNAGTNIYLYNYEKGLSFTTNLNELQNIAGDLSIQAMPMDRTREFGEVFGILDLGTENLEVQCAACQSERNQRNADAFRATAAAASLALAIAALGSCGATLGLTCGAAIAAWFLTQGAAADAAAQLARSTDALNRCLRNKC